MNANAVKRGVLTVIGRRSRSVWVLIVVGIMVAGSASGIGAQKPRGGDVPILDPAITIDPSIPSQIGQSPVLSLSVAPLLGGLRYRIDGSGFSAGTVTLFSYHKGGDNTVTLVGDATFAGPTFSVITFVTPCPRNAEIHGYHHVTATDVATGRVSNQLDFATC